jgi:hypothetical protein
MCRSSWKEALTSSHRTMQANQHKLLHGPYNPPALRRGDRTQCLYRDTEVVITSWTDARIPWPRCRAIGVRGGSGLLLTEELVRAIRTECAEAIKHWFGVSANAVWNWRKAFDVARWGTEGSRRLLLQMCEAGAKKLRGKKRPLAAIQKQIQTCRQLGYKPPQKRWAMTGWKQWQLDLLGTAPDAELAARFGRTVTAVRVMRNRLGRRRPKSEHSSKRWGNA